MGGGRQSVEPSALNAVNILQLWAIQAERKRSGSDRFRRVRSQLGQVADSSIRRVIRVRLTGL